MLFLLFLGTAFVNAQVRMGANAAPEKGAVLDLNSSVIASGFVGGLLLPHVSLTDLNTVPAAWIGKPDAVPANLAGLLVFNDGISVTPRGIYVWDGTAWILIQEKPVIPCEGAVIFNGAYTGPKAGNYVTGLNDTFVAGWRDAAFTPKNVDLCWDKADVSVSTTLWASGTAACSGEWRLPNLQELQVLYDANGGNGSSGADFRNLNPALGVNIAADNMKSVYYWSSTEASATGAYVFAFYNGGRYNYGKANTSYARCVRDLN